jgi:hypothetical protein
LTVVFRSLSLKNFSIDALLADVLVDTILPYLYQIVQKNRYI